MWSREEESGRREELFGANRRNGRNIHRIGEKKRKPAQGFLNRKAPGKVVKGDQWMEGDDG